MHLVEISIFSLNHVVVRLAKIMNNLLENSKFILSKSFFRAKSWSNLSPKKFYEEYLTRRPTFIENVFANFDF